MKILVVIYYDGSAESVTRPLAKLSPLQAEMGFSADLYVYGEKDPDNFQIGNFEGRAYFQRFEVAAAEWVAEAVRALVARNQYYGVIAADQEQASALAVLMANKLDYDFVTGVVSMSGTMIGNESGIIICLTVRYSGYSQIRFSPMNLLTYSEAGRARMFSGVSNCSIFPPFIMQIRSAI